jgi:hypothetical protein
MQMKRIGNHIESRQWTFRVNYPTDAHVSDIVHSVDNNTRLVYIASVRNHHNNLTLATTGIIVFDVPRSLNWLHQHVSANSIWNALTILPN